jgi:short subunit dehydrogenase-like uncharacterized protein
MKQTNRFFIYGATGYTGKLAARTAKEKGLEPILAGRNEAKLKALAEPLGFQYRAFDLSDKAKLDKALGEVDAVVHIAGPFSANSKPMADALTFGVWTNFALANFLASRLAAILANHLHSFT